MQSISHPNVVRVLSYGTTLQNEPFVVMEFVDGPGLNSLIIGRSPLLDGRRVRMIRAAAEALQAVHRAGFIHRDVCPRNFMASARWRIDQADRFWPFSPSDASLYATRKSHGHPELHGA